MPGNKVELRWQRTAGQFGAISCQYGPLSTAVNCSVCITRHCLGCWSCCGDDRTFLCMKTRQARRPHLHTRTHAERHRERERGGRSMAPIAMMMMMTNHVTDIRAVGRRNDVVIEQQQQEPAGEALRRRPSVCLELGDDLTRRRRRVKHC